MTHQWCGTAILLLTLYKFPYSLTTTGEMTHTHDATFHAHDQSTQTFPSFSPTSLLQLRVMQFNCNDLRNKIADTYYLQIICITIIYMYIIAAIQELNLSRTVPYYYNIIRKDNDRQRQRTP